MSYWIQYQSAMFALSDGVRQTRFVYAIEGGSNNLTQRTLSGREAGVRDWYIAALGTQNQVLRQTVRIAGDCESGGLKMYRVGRVSPEQYIRSVRRQLNNPRLDGERHITLAASVESTHPLIQKAAENGLTIYQDCANGKERCKLIPPDQSAEHWIRYFELLNAYLDCADLGGLQPGYLGEVFGMPSSYC